MKAKKVYYSVFGLKDGTVCAVLPVPKPRKTQHGPAPEIDPEGVSRCIVEDDLVPSQMTECHRTVFHTADSTALNMKRILREQVSGRLDSLEQTVADTREQLDRIDQKLAQLLRGRANDGEPG